MAQLYQNRHKNAESHLFGDEPPPEHYEIAPETIQGLRDANNNRRKAMESNLFAGENKPSIQNIQSSASSDLDNRHKNQESHLGFGATPSPQIQPQLSQPNQYQNSKYQQSSYSNQKQKYQPPHMPPTQIHLKTKLQPLAPAPNQDDYNTKQITNQGSSLLNKFRQNQDQPVQQFSQFPPPQQQTRLPISQLDYNSIPNLNENLAMIDNTLPTISPRKFVIEDKSSQNSDNQQHQPQPTRATISTPRHPTFIYTQVKETQLPTFQITDLVQNGQIPQLTPFPNFDFDLAPIDNNFTFAVKPLTSSGQRYPKKLNLNNSVGNEMRKMRDELEKDAQQFDTRIKRIEKVDIIQPIRPITPVSEDPPSLDFSFATPRSMWNFNRRPTTNESESPRGRKNNIKNDVPDLNLTNPMNGAINNNNNYYGGGGTYNDDDDGEGGPGLMSTQSDFIYLDNPNTE